MSFLEICKDISIVVGAITGATLLLMTIFKPMRDAFINKIISTSKVVETEKIISEVRIMFADIKGSVELHNKASKCMLENRIVDIYEQYKNSEHIPAFEKDALIEHYKLCKEFGADGKVDFRYNALMEKKLI